MRKQWFVFKPIVVAIAFVGLMACGASVSENGNAQPGGQAMVLGGDTPEAVFERVRRAAETRDMRELAASIDPEQLGELAVGLTFISGMIVMFSALDEDNTIDTEAKTEELEEILTRYGLPSMDDDSEGPEMDEAFAEVGHEPMINLISELAGFLDGLGEADEDVNSEFLPPMDGDLTGLLIDGETATASIGEETVEFVQIDQRWFVRLPEAGGMSADGGEGWADWDDRNRAGSEDAMDLAVPASGEHVLGDDGRSWYRFQAPESGTLRLATRASGSNDGDLVIEAYLDEDFGDWVARSDADRDGDPANEVIDFGLQAGQILHVRVAQWGMQQDALSYQFEASFTPGEVEEFVRATSDWSSDFFVPEPDHTEAAANAMELAVGEDREVRLDRDDTHWYVITAPANGTLSFTTRGTGSDEGDLRLEAFTDGDFSSGVDYSDSDIGGDYAHETVSAPVRAGEQMVVRVWAWPGGGEFATYRLMTAFGTD